MHSFIHLPVFIENWRTRREIDRQIAAHPKNWRIRRVPAVVLRNYKKHAEALILDIYSSGAMPVLMTHALRITKQTYKTDESATLWVLSTGPRANTKAWIENDSGSNAMLKEIATEHHFPVVHLSRKMTGCKPCFFDGAHFTNKGAAHAAAAAAKVLSRLALKNGFNLEPK